MAPAVDMAVGQDVRAWGIISSRAQWIRVRRFALSLHYKHNTVQMFRMSRSDGPASAWPPELFSSLVHFSLAKRYGLVHTQIVSQRRALRGEREL